MDKLSKSERSGWEWLASKGHAKSGEYAAALGVDDRTVRRHLNQFFRAVNHLRRFQELGLLEKAGSARATKHKVRRP